MSCQGLLFLSLMPLVLGQLADLRFNKTLDTEGRVLLLWDFNKTTEEITFALHVRTTGWIGFGLSPSGGMTGADIVIGGVSPSSNQSTYFADYHGIGEVTPVRDAVQNYKLKFLSENDGLTTMRFSRKFRTCDPFDVDVTANTQRIIAAYGTSDTIRYHGASQRFMASVQLLSEAPVSGPDPEPSFTYDIKMSNFSIPSDATTYGCAYIPLPQLPEKNHIYKFDSIIQDGNEDVVHHILVYACPNSTNVTIAPATCNDNPDFYACSEVIVGWAVGGKAFTFPSNTGIPLGKGVAPTYVRLEIHYNNEMLQSGRKDSSGIRLYYTPVLREHDVGVLTTGIVPRALSFIPPRAESFNLYSLCKTDVFNQVTGEVIPDMQMFANLLHTHLTGTAVQVAQFRNGTQIGFLGRDMSYDFNLQETRQTEIMPIKMGDELQTVCTYNTLGRANVTFGGISTTEEMCLAFLYYYPRNNISQCVSIPDYSPVSSFLGFNITRNQSALNLLPWTPNNITWLQQATKEAFHLNIVFHSNFLQESQTSKTPATTNGRRK
ncbi:putative DBH-like monooxygenase protein 2 isoform X2 [Pleurodeles waltl]|uniref:putative DBH-like monooxygenase protein 2 isoform X2 n=1 Tax=Pleurodeles waltl TaxID=8319 RepID=UPI003709B2FF